MSLQIDDSSRNDGGEQEIGARRLASVVSGGPVAGAGGGGPKICNFERPTIHHSLRHERRQAHFFRQSRQLAQVGLVMASCFLVSEASGMGGKIAFTSFRDGNWEIYVMNEDGSGQTNVTNTADTDYAPSFNGDGSKIVFYSRRDGNAEIYVMNSDGTGQTRLTFNSSEDVGPSFNGDGTKITFMSTRDGNPEIYVMNSDGSGQTRLTNHIGDDGTPSFIRDGSKIVFSSNRDGNYEIYVMNADGSNQTRLTNNLSHDAWAGYSPDGSRITFTTNRDGNSEIYVMNSDGTGQTRLTSDSARDMEPKFNADGSKIAFWTDRDGNKEVYVMNADGSGQSNLTSNGAADEGPSYPMHLSTTVTPNTLFLLRGLVTAGGISDLFFSDDLRLEVRAGLTLFLGESPLQAVMTGTSPVESPTELRFTLESSVNTPGLTQTIELFNYDTSSYEEVDLSIPGAMDATVAVSITVSPERFVQAGTREMRARVLFKRVGLTLLWPWSAKLDQAVWGIVH